MAIYSLSPTNIGRGTGRQAVAASAYRSGSKLTDERTGQTWDFTRKGGVLHSEIVTPQAVPIWAGDRERLWNEAEKAEDKSTRRDTAKLAREFRIALPHELTDAERVAITREFSRYLVDRYGAAVDFSVHSPDREGDQRNFHAHVMMTTRALGPDGYGVKIRSLDSPKTSGAEMLAVRAEWAAIANRALEAGGHAERIDHRRLVDQGIDREATVHEGVAVTNMERNGERTDVGNLNREIAARNAEREALKAEGRAISAEIIDLEAEREKRAADRDERAAVRTFDPGRILEQITERKSTFSRADLNYALSKEITDPKERAAMNDAILARPEVVALREQSDGPVTRYTTRAVLDAERDVLSDAASMAADSRHGLTSRQQAEALDRHAKLDHEQRAALAHLTGPEGIAILVGEAGTGKSTVLGAARDAYSTAGHHVIGMSWQNSIVQDMRRGGFDHATTVKAELMRLESGRTRWDARTVVVIDEAAMLATKDLAAVTAHAKASGAKVIAAGDDHQLPSIERGGMFGALKETHGAAEIHTVYRVRDSDQQEAFNLMWRGEFTPALRILDDHGAIRWTDTAEEAKAALVEKYRADLAADPDKTRFAFAYTNADVATLNADLRAMQRERGALGEDHRLETAHGPQDFASGDRVQFTANAPTKAQKDAGFVNGSFGTVREIDGQRMTVELDGGAGGKARVVAFDVTPGGYDGIKHGYAGTIYKGQGKTLDQTYLLHSKHWRETSSYVAATRHRDETAIFVAKDAARDLPELARQMGRIDEHRSASQFHADAGSPATPDMTRLYRGVGKNVWEAGPGDAVFFTTDPERAAVFGKVHFVDVTTAELAKFEQPHSRRILDAEPAARNDWRTADPAIIARLQPVTAEPTAERGGNPREGFATAATEAAGRPQTPTAPDTLAKAPEPVHPAPTRQQVEAHRKAAKIARIKDPAQQAAALYRLHKADAIQRAKGAGPKGEAPAPTRSSGTGSSAERHWSAKEALAEVRREAAKEREAERPHDQQHQRERPRGRTR